MNPLEKPVPESLEQPKRKDPRFEAIRASLDDPNVKEVKYDKPDISKRTNIKKFVLKENPIDPKTLSGMDSWQREKQVEQDEKVDLSG